MGMTEEQTTQPENPKERDKVISFQLNVPTVDLQQLQVQPEALALVPLRVALE
ncbi:unnamed protein product, partial [marine sediment metagenome]